MNDWTMTTTSFSRAFNLALLFFGILATPTMALADAQAVDEAWRKAILANDVNAVMALYATDAVMWLPDGPEPKGGRQSASPTLICWLPIP
jgi:hypothetical protein